MRAQQEAARFAAAPGLKGASVSVCISDLISGEVVDAFQPHQRLCPASVWKLFTTAAALDLLGPDFRFRTLLAADGPVVDGTLQGNLIILGGGDPSLGSRHFPPGFDGVLQQWSAAVSRAGIDSIQGNIIANEAYYRGETLPRTRIWADMANYYGTGAWGINFRDNSYEVLFQTPAEANREAKVIDVYPEVPTLSLSSEVRSSTTASDQAYIFGAPLVGRRVVRGTLPRGRQEYSISGSLPDPPLFAAHHLRKELLKAGIYVGGQAEVEREVLREPATLQVVHELLSPPLSSLVAHTNRVSDNLYAEALLLQLGAAKGGDGSVVEALDVLRAHLLPHCGTDYPFYAYDGSGLSRYTAVSAAQVNGLLRYCHSNEHTRGLMASLPIAGQEGTVRYFLKDSPLQGLVRAKSGSMEGVRAYAGYFSAHSGRQLAFTILVNNYDLSWTALSDSIEEMLVKTYYAH